VVAPLKARLKRCEARLGKAQQRAHQRQGVAQQGRGAVQALVHILQAGGGGTQAVPRRGPQVQADADDDAAPAAAVGDLGGFDQDARELAPVIEPQIVGPLELQARRRTGARG